MLKLPFSPSVAVGEVPSISWLQITQTSETSMAHGTTWNSGQGLEANYSHTCMMQLHKINT